MSSAARSPAAGGGLPPRYQFGQFVLCPATLSLRQNGGEPLRLRPKTIATLIYLIENRSRVVGKDELIGQVWDGIAVTDDVLVGCIHEIRHAVGDDARHGQVIRTVPKTGYQFVAPVVEKENQAGTVPEEKPKRPPVLVVAFAAVTVAALLVVLRFWVFRPRRVTEVGWWRFSESTGNQVLDSSGMGNNGRMVGKLERTPGPGTARALRFDGASYITGRGKGFPAGDRSFTITAWIQTTALPPHGASLPIFHFGAEGWEPRSNAHLLLTDRGAACFGFGYGYVAPCGTQGLADGKWHFLAGMYSTHWQRVVLYVDGADYARAAAPRPAALPRGSNWTIGSFLSGGEPFIGQLADVRLFNGQLSQPQIGALRRCMLSTDVALPGLGNGYFVPLYRATVDPPQPGSGAGFAYTGFGSGGVEFGRSDGACSLASVRGAALAHDLHIHMEIELPAGTEGGPFFGAHRVRPGDPIEGAGFGGCWLRLHATGEVTVERLDHAETQRVAPIASGVSPVKVGSGEWHSLDAELRGRTLQAWVDGALVRFRQGGRTADSVSLNGLSFENAAGVGVVEPARPTYSVLVRHLDVTVPKS